MEAYDAGGSRTWRCDCILINRVLKCDIIKKNFTGELFFGSTPKIRRVCMEFSEHNWATISETICREMLIFGK